MKEYGVDQYEVTIGAAEGVGIADQAVILRELVRGLAGQMGDTASFTPMRSPDGVGNGVHVHLSFRDQAGRPVAFDPNGPHHLAPVAGSFIAGILKYLDAFLALTAASVLSYRRLTPHRWSAAFNNLGYRDREAAVRICPVFEGSDIAAADQFNFEFRAADAAASPYLLLAALVHAGVQGIEEGLPTPPATEEDLARLSADALSEKGYRRLPQSLEEALERFSASQVVKGWFEAPFPEIYLKHKKGEISFLADKDEAEVFAAYRQAY